jgi:AcrR family transcriptional regulator
MDKTQVIISTAIRLFVQNGFHGTATSKIAQEANIANGTLFNYFATKEILIISIYNSVVKKMDDSIMESFESRTVSKESFRSLFLATLQWNIQNPIEYHYLQQFNNSPFSKSSNLIVSSVEEHPLYILIQNGINLVLLKPMPVSFLFSIFLAQINGFYSYLILNKIEIGNSMELVDETFELLWNMIQD